jgi:tight adherence protein B
MTATTALFDRQLPLLLRIFENTLRAGYSMTQSFEIIARDLTDPAGSDVRQVVQDITNGMALSEALDRWLIRTPSGDLNLLIALIRVQLEVGGNLADKLNLLAQMLDHRSPLHR